MQVHGPGRDVRERLEPAGVRWVQGGQVHLVLLPQHLLWDPSMCAADTTCPCRYCSLECQTAAQKCGGHRKACRDVQKAAGTLFCSVHAQ